MNPYGYQPNAVYQTPYYGSVCPGTNRGVSWIVHKGHGRTAQDKEELRVVFVLVNELLQDRRYRRICLGKIGILVDDKDETFFQREAENVFEGFLERLEDGRYALLDCSKDSTTQVFEILLLAGLDSSKEDSLFVLDELADKGCFANAPPSIDNGMLKFLREPELFELAEFFFSADKHEVPLIF